MKNSTLLRFIRIFILLICLTSCGSKKQQKVALPTDFKEPKELARLYGACITPEDGIFLRDEGTRWLGIRRKLGGSTKWGADCSDFASVVYWEVHGKQLARSSADVLKHNCKKVNRARSQEGDLVFFKTGRDGRRGVPSHMGTYSKNGRFIHINTSSGVTVSNLGGPYYTKTWLMGGRVK